MTPDRTQPSASSAWLRRKRARLLISCALGSVIGIAAPAGQAQAQAQDFSGAFRGSMQVVAGSAGRASPAPNTDVITVNSRSAVVNWTPFDSSSTGAIDFLPSGATATFQGPVGTDFAILNRILPNGSARIGLNGTIISQLRTSAETTSRGGTVAFYTPNGFIVGRNAVFNIGSLLMTTIDPAFDSEIGDFFVNSDTYSLDGTVSSDSSVIIEEGAQISAEASGSYVAIVAPRIEQHGTVQVDGSVVYVAAESAQLTINNGLFDIRVDTGSSASANTLIHDGNTGGPASTGPSDFHKIYMVAVPKNEAITALLSGTVGYGTATSATFENGEIVLSAGYNVNGRFTTATRQQVVARGDQLFGASSGDDISPATDIAASFHITGGTFTSDVIGRAATDFQAASATQPTTFRQDVTLIGRESAQIAARGGQTVTIDGSATVTSGTGDSYRDKSSNGGVSLLFAEVNSTLAIRGSARADSSARGLEDSGATGGTASIRASGGTVTIGGSARVDASGLAGRASTSLEPEDVGEAVGGVADFSATDNGRLTIAGRMDGEAMGVGGTANGAGDGIPGEARGGTVSVLASAGAQIRAASMSLNAGGAGGASAGGVSGGSGIGGLVQVETLSGGLVGLSGTAQLRARGEGGSARTQTEANGGRGSGGTALLIADGGRFSLGGTLQVDARGQGGQAIGSGNIAGAGLGGVSDVLVSGAAGQLAVGGSAQLFAMGVGGSGSVSGTGANGTAAPPALPPRAGPLRWPAALPSPRKVRAGTARAAAMRLAA